MSRNVFIQVRRGTSSEWSTSNPVLAAGEPGFDSTLEILKIGNGTDQWDDLPSIGGQGLSNVVEDTTPQLGGELDGQNNDITAIGTLSYKAAKPAIVTDTDASTITFNMNSADVHQVVLGGNRTLALSHVSAGQRFIIRLTQDGTGSRTVTWFSGIKWPGGVVPTLTTTGNKTDVFGFICTATGNYDGFVIGYNL